MPLLAALSFLTIWRPPARLKFKPEDWGASLFFFAPVGLLIGGILAAIDLLARRLWPSAVGTVIVLAVMLLLTGGLHFDGLLDTCDGALSPRSPERRLEIMRDSRSGSFAIGAGVLDLLLLWGCIVDLTGPQQYAALLVMAVSSRAGMALVLPLFPYARQTGLGKDFHDHASRWSAAVGGIIALAASTLLLGWQGGVACLAGLAAAVLTGMYLMTRIPGLTGDCYGAINEVVQAVSLLVLVALFV